MFSRRTVLTTIAGAIAQAPLGGALGAIVESAGPTPTGVGPLLPSPPIALERFMGYRYGAFIHWGPATVLGREISWTRQVKTPYREYDALYKRFNPTEFDAEAWVRALLDGGFHYLTFVTKHHEGFAMWDTKTTDHNIMRSPFGRDVVKEISEACRKLKLPLSFYYSIADFYNPDCVGATNVGEYSANFYKPDPTKPIDTSAENLGPPGYSLPAGQKPDFNRYVSYMKAQLKELTENYGPVLSWWFDGGWQKEWTYDRGVDLLKYLRSLQPDTLTDQRIGTAFNGNVYMPTWFPTDKKHVGDYAVLEVDMPRFNREIPWEYTTPANDRSYAWTPGPYGDPTKWIENLVKSACGDGNYILGVSAPPTGRFEPELIDKLKQADAWLRRYGESVYETRGGVYKRTNTYGSTCKGNKIFLHVFDTTATKLVLPPLPKKIRRSIMLNGGEVKVGQTDQAVTVEIGPYDFQTPTTIVMLELESSAEEITPIGETPLNRDVAVRSSNEDPLTDRLASDGDMSTFWKADGNTVQPWLEYDLGSEKSISRAILFEGEYEGECSNIHKLQLEAQLQGQWKPITDLLTTWGNGEPPFDDWPISILHPEIRFPPVKVQHVRLKMLRVSGRPIIHEFALYER
jgi:alpha-L-fucosidase